MNTLNKWNVFFEDDRIVNVINAVYDVAIIGENGRGPRAGASDDHSMALCFGFEPSTVAPFFQLINQLVSKWNSVSKSLIRKSCPLRYVVLFTAVVDLFLFIYFFVILCFWSGFKRNGFIRKQLIDDFSSGRMCFVFFFFFLSFFSSFKV